MSDVLRGSGWHAKLDAKRLVLDPASPSEAGQSVNPASQGRMGATETMWARVRFFVTMGQKLRKVPTKSCIHGMYGAIISNNIVAAWFDSPSNPAPPPSPSLPPRAWLGDEKSVSWSGR